MNINSLISHDNDGQSERRSSSEPAQTQPKKRPRPVVGTRTPSLLSQEIVISPSPEPPRSGHLDNVGPHGNVRSSITPLPSPGIAGGRSTHLDARPGSSSSPADRSMTLSPMRSGASSRGPSQASAPTSHARHLAPPNIRTHSASDIAMAEAPAQTPPPRNFTASSISDADLKTISELTSYLADHSYDYDSHIQLINLLHRGFVAYVDAPLGDSMLPSQPGDFSLLQELRMARSAMDSRYSVGEDIWRDWINDESVLAKSSEDRTAVMELCMKAVQEEPASIVLWSLYGEWVWSTYSVANGHSEGDEDTWTEEDKMICKEIFTRALVMQVWSQAVEAVKWRMDESHVVWNRYMELILQDTPDHPSPKAVEDIQMLYMARLQVPHATWDDTSQAFWSFISKHKSGSWEEIMAATNELAAPAKQQTNMRTDYEVQVTVAYRQDDRTALYNAFSAYLGWESKHKKKGPFDVELRCILYERALLRFPTMIEWWLDYVDFLTYRETIDNTQARSKVILPLLERATRHCPWSGVPWARRLLRMEFESYPMEDVHDVKNKATNSGLLPMGGLEDFILLYTTFCSYLRRRAFMTASTDDDADVANQALSDALDQIQFRGTQIYRDSFRGDPHWRIEKIYIQFLTQARRINEAREIWAKLVHLHRTSYDFWSKYYDWEMMVWGMERGIFKASSETAENTPRKASDVLREAIAVKDLDWPEKLHEIYADHFTNYEAIAEIQAAEVDLRRSKMFLKVRREKEAAEAEAGAQSQSQVTAEDIAAVDTAASSTKRKREEEIDGSTDMVSKKNKTASAPEEDKDGAESVSSMTHAKRDREHNTIKATNFPQDASEKTIRRFFQDCGKILTLSTHVDTKSSSLMSIIEFETHEDFLAALTRGGKTVDGHEIGVEGHRATLYVTNYPDSWSEEDMRELFKDYGTIVSLRFPSLAHKERRRFSYVQFLSAEEAQRALEVHDKTVDGGFRLVVLVSDPKARKTRQGATAEGREVHVRNVEHSATQEEIEQHFSQVGKVESVRMMRGKHGNFKDRFTGTAFVIFADADAAQKSLTLNQKPLGNRLIGVTLATDKSTLQAANKKPGTSKTFESTNTDAPASDQTSSEVPSAPTDSADPVSAPDAASAMTRRDRTVALLNLPDTVNDARVHAFFANIGEIRKLTIRRDKQGALIEFVSLEDAGRAGLQTDLSALGPDCKVDTPAALMQPPPKKVPSNNGTSTNGPPPASGAGQGKLMRPATVSRPAQRPVGLSTRGGRKPGLGVKRNTAAATDVGDAGGAAKSNADFRAIFLAGKKTDDPVASEADGESKVDENGAGEVENGT